MSSTQLKLAVAFMLLLSSNLSAALPFGSFDPRSMAMGGAGVAVGDAALAPIFNPALLSVTRYSDRFSMILPSAGIQYADPDSLISSVEKFQAGNYLDSLQTSITNLQNAITSGVIADVNSTAATASSNLSNVSAQLDTLSNKPLSVNGGIATVIALPDKDFGAAFYANRTIAIGAAFQYRDAPVFADLPTKTGCLSSATTVAAVTACGVPTFSTSNVQSGLDIRGSMFTEIGASFSRETRINRELVSLGITPKIVQAQIYEIPINVNTKNLSIAAGDDYMARYNMLNFDIGVVQNLRTGWRGGLVIKNIIPYFLYYKNAPSPGVTPVSTGNSLRLIPQSRVGISHANRWSTVALDLDLYRNDPAGVENYTQYLSLGGELSSWGWAQLRAGYRADLVNSSRNIFSLGFGFSPFGAHADFAVAGNAKEYGASFQLGFQY